MTRSDWEWVSASAVGTSHLRVNKGCDDSGACVLVCGANQASLVAVCSDGAGSAKRSSVGSRIVSRAFCRSARRFLQSGRSLSELTREVAEDWLDDMRGRIENVAGLAGLAPRDFAATLIGCIATDDGAKILHVGDGAAVYRASGCADWSVGSWPSNGEYAATTYFVTDDPEPSFVLSTIDGVISELAVFTDGIEHLVLDYSSKTAFGPFFDKMFSAFGTGNVGKNRPLSRHLSAYLESPVVCDRTDDDKTLLLARRVRNVAAQEYL